MSTPASNNSNNNGDGTATKSTSSSVWPTIAMPTSDATIQYSGKYYRQIEAVESIMNYCDDHVREMQTRRDLGGTDSGLEGASWIAPRVMVRNARLQEGEHKDQLPTLDQKGYQLAEHSLRTKAIKSTANGATPIDFSSKEDVTDRYYPLCEELLKKDRTIYPEDDAPAMVYAFDHNLRVSGSKNHDEQGDTVLQQPIGVVHNDYTHVSAPRRLEQLAQPPKANDVLKSRLEDNSLLDPEIVQEILKGQRRFCFVNVWRNMDTTDHVQQFPLACASADTTSMDDLLTFQIIYKDRIGENYFSRFTQRHQWNYFPHMKHSEALLIKQWDSHGTLAQQEQTAAIVEDNNNNNKESKDADADTTFRSTFSLHSAFQDPTSPEDAPPRRSIEVRCVLVWDKKEGN